MEWTSNTVPAIDVHCHYVPAAYRQAQKDAGRYQIDGWPMPVWSAQRHIEDMDRMNVSASVLGLSSPSLNWGDIEKARFLARDANEEGAKAVQAYPNRLGFFAILPIPDVDASLAEIEYALDVLRADGVVFHSNSNGVYLGDPVLDPVMAELSRRNAIVHLHPVKPSAVPEKALVGIPIPTFEFMFDSTRAVANMIYNGTLRRNPGVKFICPHMGTLLPLMSGRMAGSIKLMMDLKTWPEDWQVPDVMAELKNLYYDGGGAFNLAIQIPALKGIADTAKILVASDYPHTPVEAAKQLIDGFRTTDCLTEKEKVGILRTNALTLFPRFA
jgi:6-methylsalicylate decarboxylase